MPKVKNDLPEFDERIYQGLMGFAAPIRLYESSKAIGGNDSNRWTLSHLGLDVEYIKKVYPAEYSKILEHSTDANHALYRAKNNMASLAEIMSNKAILGTYEDRDGELVSKLNKLAYTIKDISMIIVDEEKLIERDTKQQISDQLRKRPAISDIYTLLPHQRDFILAQNATGTTIKALVAGFGSGKTFAFLWETFKQHTTIFNKFGKSFNMVIYPTLELARELFIEPFKTILDDREIKYTYNISRMRFETEFGTVICQSLQRPEKIVGVELTSIGFDEFDVESEKNCSLAYNKALGRLRGCQNPTLYIVTTPEGFKVTYREMVEKPSPEKFLIRAKSSSNPYLPPAYLESLRSQYDEKLLEQYLDGEFVNLVGQRAYYQFDRDRNVKKYSGKRTGQLIVGMDFNVNPMAAVVGKVSGQDLLTLHFFEEIVLKNSNTQQMCDVLRQKYGDADIVVCPDMTGVKRVSSAEIGISDIKILRQNGFNVEGNSNPFVRDRLNTINREMQASRVLIDPSCKELIKDFDQVVLDKHGQIDKSDTNRTHISDACGYAVWRTFRETNQGWRS